MFFFGAQHIVKGGGAGGKRASINNQAKFKCDEIIGACSGMAGSRIQVMELLRSGDCRRMTLTQVIFFFIADSVQTEYCPTFLLSVRLSEA